MVCPPCNYVTVSHAAVRRNLVYFGRVCFVITTWVSHAAVRNHLMSLTFTFLSPLTDRFVAVKDIPMLEVPCDIDSSSIWSGSSTGTLYFGSPAELPYVSAFIKTEKMFTHQLACYQTGCHLLTHSLSVVTTHLTVSKICHHYRAHRLLLKRKIFYICVRVARILQPCMFYAEDESFAWTCCHLQGRSYIRVSTVL